MLERLSLPGCRRAATAVGLVVLVGLASTAVATPVAPPSVVSRTRADVVAIAQSPRPMGSPAIEEARAAITQRLVDIGLEPEQQATLAPDVFGAPGDEVEVVNVLARIRGTGAGDAILLMAHHDTVPWTPGANDNAAAVAALLDTARSLRAGAPLRNDVILLFTDGEEPAGRYGASAFVDHPWFADVQLALNFEAVGDAGPSMLVMTHGPDAVLVDGLAAGTSDPVAFSFLTATADLIGGATTDFDVMRANDVPGMVFTYLRGGSIYHTGDDSIEHLHQAGMAHHAAIAIGVTKHFGDADLGELAATGQLVHLTLPGGHLVGHAPGWLWPVLVLAALLTAVNVARSTDHRSVWSVLRGLAAVVGGAVSAAVVVALVWTAIVAARPRMGAGEAVGHLGLLLVVVIAMWAVLRRTVRRREIDLDTGVLITWMLLATGLTALAPGLGAPFVWVAAGGVLAAAVSTLGRAGPVRRTIGGWIGAAITVVVTVPMVDTFFQLAGPRPGNPGSELPMVAVVVGLLAFLAIGLVAVSLARAPAATHRSPDPTARGGRDTHGAGGVDVMPAGSRPVP